MFGRTGATDPRIQWTKSDMQMTSKRHQICSSARLLLDEWAKKKQCRLRAYLWTIDQLPKHSLTQPSEHRLVQLPAEKNAHFGKWSSSISAFCLLCMACFFALASRTSFVISEQNHCSEFSCKKSFKKKKTDNSVSTYKSSVLCLSNINSSIEFFCKIHFN